MTNKTLGNILITTLVLVVFTGIFESSMYIDTANALYTIAGFSWAVFGTWAGFRLRKQSTDGK
jgi:hypothetical protein